MARSSNMTRLQWLVVILSTASLIESVQSTCGQLKGTETTNSARSRFKPLGVLDFKQFKATFNKHYNSKLEELPRQQVYLSRAASAFVSQLLYKFGQSSAYRAINDMSDWTRNQSKQMQSDTTNSSVGERFSNQESLDYDAEHRGSKSRSRVARKPDELYHDYRDHFSEVKNQGHCGSCSMFSTLALYEWMYFVSSGKRVSFSEQYLLDCSRFGCTGCYPNEVMDFVDKFGLEDGQLYPYFERKKRCPFNRRPSYKTGRWRVQNMRYKSIRREEFARALDTSPILTVISIDAELFKQYRGGVDQAPTCNKPASGSKDIYPDYHAVLIVGDGREDGQDYWLIRNSHGPKWGESGHYKLSKEATTRCISDDLSSSLVVRPGFKIGLNPSYNSETVERWAPIWHKRLELRRNAGANQLVIDDEEGDDYVANPLEAD